MIVAKVFRKEEGGEWIMLAAMSRNSIWNEIEVLDIVHTYQQQDFKRGVKAFYSVQLQKSRRLEYTIPCWYESITSVSMN